MSRPLHPDALFRLMVLGPLASRGELKRGEVSTIIRELASKAYDIPNSRRTYLSPETIKRWYYDWMRGGIDALQQLQLSKRILPSVNTIEHRSFVAARAGELWQGDVLHGPSIQTKDGMRKTYLVSLMDDASRLLAHSAFCFGETALDIEGVLKQAVLKRGRPYKLLVDNGAAYKSGTLQAICARLEIRLIYCKPYSPEGKGKLERFHRTFREQFLNELDLNRVANIDELNARLWAWIESVYHARPHAGLDKLDTHQHQTPVGRWRQDLSHVRPLTTAIAERLDDIFCHYVVRTVRKDGTVSWDGNCFEVHHNLVGDKVTLVVDPHHKPFYELKIRLAIT